MCMVVPVLSRLKTLISYRMAFSRWLWLYAVAMVGLITIAILGSVRLQPQGLIYDALSIGVLALIALTFTTLTVRYFRRFIARVERFAESIASGNLTTSLPIQNEHGEVKRILQTLNTMQAQLRTSFESLRSEEEHNALLVQAINQSSNSVMVTDLQARIVYVNDAFVDNSGYAREEIIGRTPKVLQSGKTSSKVYSDMRALLAQGRSWRGELINRRKDGSEFIETVTITPVREASGEIYRYMAVKEDVTEMRRAQDSIERLAYYDPLTDLPNRRYFLDQLNRKIAYARRHGKQLALIFIDLNRFKEINDSQGHLVGDKVLIEVARRFSEQIRQEDVLARLGGDEFVLLMDDANLEFIDTVVQRLLRRLRHGVRVDEGRFDISASFGVALYPEHGDNSADLLRHADIAMYQAKAASGSFVMYDRTMSARVEREVTVAGRLQQALKDDQGLVLYVQGQFDLRSNALSGAEVLLRWHDELLGTISPGEFIPVAEERGLISILDRFVIERACSTLADWRERAAQSLAPAIKLTVNVSMTLFEEADFVSWLKTTLAYYRVPASELGLEITESGLMQNPAGALRTAASLKTLGTSLAIDDFGTGYSSLAYLKQFNASTVKIDQSFIRGIDRDERSQAIVRATIRMVHELGMDVLAEGVETEAEAQWLMKADCEFGQGYLYAHPLPLDEFTDTWLTPR